MREAKAKGFVVGIISNHLDFWFETCAEAFSLSEIVPPNLVVVSQVMAFVHVDGSIKPYLVVVSLAMAFVHVEGNITPYLVVVSLAMAFVHVDASQWLSSTWTAILRRTWWL